MTKLPLVAGELTSLHGLVTSAVGTFRSLPEFLALLVVLAVAAPDDDDDDSKRNQF